MFASGFPFSRSASKPPQPKKGDKKKTEESSKEQAAPDTTTVQESAAMRRLAASSSSAIKRDKSVRDVLSKKLEEYENDRDKAIREGDYVKKLEFAVLLAGTKVDIATFDLDEAAKQANINLQRQAEYDRRKAIFDQHVADLEKKVAEAKAELMNPSLPEVIRQAATNIFTKYQTSLEMLVWDEEAVKKEIAETFPLPGETPSRLIELTWEHVSKAVSQLPFSINQLFTDDETQRLVLGPLFKPGYIWPVVATSSGHKRTIDMRLLPRKLFNSTGDELRPAAREISNRLKEGGLGTLALIAVPGGGKSSALIDVGHEHYVIYLQASTRTDIQGVGAMARQSREFDQNFVNMVADLASSTSIENLVGVKHSNWTLSVQRMMVELVARVLQLVRMHRELGPNLTCWSFAVHQLAGEQEFVAEGVDLLRVATVSSLKQILRSAMAELAGIFSPNCRFVVAIDEMELAAHELKERFMRPVQVDPTSTTASHPKGILSPLVAVIGDLSPIAGWSLVLAGTGTSEESVMRLKTDVGKLTISKIISEAPKFPLTQPSDVLAILNRLNLSAALREELAKGLEPPPLHFPARDSTESSTLSVPARIKVALEDYVVPARFRVLCSSIEHIRKFLDDYTDSNDILLAAIRRSIEVHQDGLQTLLLVRLNPLHPYGLPVPSVAAYLRYLVQIFVAVGLTDGRTSLVDAVTLDPQIRDLTRLGIAAASRTKELSKPSADPWTEPRSYTAYNVCERFVVDTLAGFLSREEVRSKVQEAQLEGVLSMLRNVLGTFGSTVPFKGNVVERMILERLVVLAQTCSTVKDLPFFPTGPVDASWDGWEFVPTRVEQYHPDRSTAEFLSSEDAPSVVYSPETVCRPDGIVMLRKQGSGERRAISLGMAVYTERVPKDKADSQYWTTDFSRSYLNSSHQVYAATRASREEWVAKQLHKTIALRVHVHLPHAPSVKAAASAQYQIYHREMRAAPEDGIAPNPIQSEESVSLSERDLIVNIDRSNIHKLLGSAKDNEHTRQLYELLQFATGVETGWSI